MKVAYSFILLDLLRNTPCLLWEGGCRRGKLRVTRKVPCLVKKSIPLDSNVWTWSKSNIAPWERLREVEESLRPRHWRERKLKTKLAKRKEASGKSQRQRIA
jgi:hypothetical protein